MITRANDIKFVQKDWGCERWVHNGRYCGKVLTISKGRQCSFHYHVDKEETFHVLAGRVRIELGAANGEVRSVALLNPGDTVHLPPMTAHSFSAPFEEATMFETSTHHKDEDTFRISPSGPLKYRILVVGDVMLDEYVKGVVRGKSPEAGAPLFHPDGSTIALGGAANVARAVAALGHRATLIGMTGNDAPGAKLRDLLAKERNVGNRLLYSMLKATTHKIRMINNGGQHLMRIDWHDPSRMSPLERRHAVAAILAEIPAHDAVIISDYAKGFLSWDITRVIIEEAAKLGKPVIADPKRNLASYYSGATVLTPNREEAGLLAGFLIEDYASACMAASRILKHAKAKAVLLKLDKDGMLMVSETSAWHIRPRATQVVDVTGAGDTAAAALAIALAGGLRLRDAAYFANKASSIAVTKPGTDPVTAEEMLT